MRDGIVPGSGYLIAPRLVLTSAHVVSGVGSAVDMFTPGIASRYQGKVIWRGIAGGRNDAALVYIEMPAASLPVARVVRWGRVVTYQPEIPCQTWGAPDLVQRPEQPTETVQLSGSLNPGYGYVTDRYVMSIGQQADAPQNAKSPWGGMSGAPLFCGGLLTGVIVRDPANRRHSQLEAIPSYLLLSDPEFRAAVAAHTEMSTVAFAMEAAEWQDLADLERCNVFESQPTSPAALLNAHRQVVPFRGRANILRDLHAWADQPGLGALLLHGPGGQGKTRLAQQLALELNEQRWVSLWLKARAVGANLQRLRDRAVPSLIIMDYAESRRMQLTALLDELSRYANSMPVKLLMLARTDGDWWENAQAASPITEEVLDGARVIRLSALEPDFKGRAEAYREAARSFARELVRVPGMTDQDWLARAEELPAKAIDDEGLDVALALHMTALADLLDTEEKTEDPRESKGVRESQKIEDRILSHERRYWIMMAEARNLFRALSIECLTEAMATAFLLGVDDRGQADKVLRRVSGLSDQPKVQRDSVRIWIAGLYPSPDKRPWGILQPDRLLERFIGRHIQRDPDFAINLASKTKKEQVENFLVLLTRASAHPAFLGTLDATLTKICVSFPNFTLSAISVVTQAENSKPLLEALQQVVENSKTPAKLLIDINDSIPERSHILASLAARLAERIAEIYRARVGRTPMALTELIMALNNLSVRLSEIGRQDQALEASKEALDQYRKLVSRSRVPDPNLTRLLTSYSVRLSDVGRRDEAARANEEAISILRRLANRQPAEHMPQLAIALSNYSLQMTGMGRRAEAVQASGEAVNIHRGLAHPEPDYQNPSLAYALHNHSLQLGAIGHHEEALEAVNEAITILRQLAESQPDAYLGQLALCINSYANCQGLLGFQQEALDGMIEASGIYRELINVQRYRYLPELAGTLSNLSGELVNAGRGRDALVACREAVEIYRGLARNLPLVHLTNLAMSLENLSRCLADVGRQDEAFDAASEAVEIRRDLAQAAPDAELPYLALSLNNFSINLADAGRVRQALAAITEAVDIRRKLAKEMPRAYLHDLAISLTNLCGILSGLSRLAEAIEIIGEAIRAYRQLDELRPGRWQEELDYCTRVQEQLFARLNTPGRTTPIASSHIQIKNRRNTYLYFVLLLIMLILIGFLVATSF